MTAVAPRWFMSVIGALFLSGGGFLLGLVLGVMSEQPDLIVGHLAGRGEEVEWSPDAEPGLSEPSRRSDPLAGRDAAPLGSERGVAGARPRVPVVAAPPPATRTPPPTRAAVQVPAQLPRPPAAPIRVPTRTAPAAAASSGYSVQVGAFAGSDVAQRLATRLREDGFPVYVTPSAGERDGRWRVRVGPVESKERAQRLARRLESQQQLPTWVLAEEAR